MPGRKRQREPHEDSPPAFIRVSESLQCRFFDNAWHLVTLKPLPRPYINGGRCTSIDILLEVPALRLTAPEARRRYGAEAYAVAVRRLAREELRQYPIPIRWWR